jgi:hypothetical protein
MYSIPTHPTDSGSSFTEVKNMMQKLMKALDVMEKETLDENKEIKDSKMEDQKTNPVSVTSEATAAPVTTCGELPLKYPPKVLIEAEDTPSTPANPPPCLPLIQIRYHLKIHTRSPQTLNHANRRYR